MNKKKLKKLNNELNQIDWYLGEIADAVGEIDCAKEMVEELIYKIQEELEEVKNE
jgi:hypothetical protein